MTTGVYIHIPFCVRKCLYCDFASFPDREEAFSRYVALLCGEAEERLDPMMEVDSVFFGGGTPTVLPASSLVRILECVKSHSQVHKAEITVEMNPGTVTEQSLELLLEAGVNRVSIGVQAFSDRLLKKLGRIHTASQALEAVETAYSAGFRNISIDLMYGIPDQSPEDWEETMDTAMRLPLKHLSCYSLIVEDGTPFAEMLTHQEISLPDEEKILQMEACTRAKTASKGMARYEVSNYALPGFESRHNLKYWHREPYIGLGSAAHSFLNNTRLSNTSNLDLYMKNRETGQQEGNTRTVLSEEEGLFEEVMLGFRLTQGITLSPAAFRKYRAGLEDFQNRGFLVLEKRHARLTDAGTDVMNTLLTQLMDM